MRFVVVYEHCYHLDSAGNAIIELVGHVKDTETNQILEITRVVAWMNDHL